MVNLNTNINVVNAIPNIRKWKVGDYQELEDRAKVVVVVYGAGTAIYGRYALRVRNVEPCIGLIVNPTSLTMIDQLITTPITIANAFDAFDTAYGVVGNRVARLKALEAVCLSTGLLSADFAGPLAAKSITR